MIFGDTRVAFDILILPRDQLAMVNAEKSFQLGLDGEDELSYWWMETLSMMLNAGNKYGTRLADGDVVTSGGRVLCAVALGDTVTQAQARAYELADKIRWEGVFYRRDIGWRAVARET